MYLYSFHQFSSIIWVRIKNVCSFRVKLEISSLNVPWNLKYFYNSTLLRNQILHNFLEAFMSSSKLETFVYKYFKI